MTEAPRPGVYSSYADFGDLRFERPATGVLLITIDRPEVLNAANERLHRELAEVWAVVDADDSVAVSVITGAGRAFSAGGDLAMVEAMTSDHAAVVEQWRDANAVVEKILVSVKPIVSAINGVAVGAGLAVALLADVSVMGSTARASCHWVRRAS
jgi:enoyl-CoA hydratase